MLEAAIIDEITEELSASEKAMTHTLDLMNEEQPVLLAYLFSETFDVFTEREQAFIVFLSAVIWKSIYQVYGPQDEVTEDAIGQAEDHNWELLNSVKARQFRDRLTVFFEEFPEAEELLAFVEDAVLADDDSPVTKEGREPIFVSLKAFVDCLLRPNLD